MKYVLNIFSILFFFVGMQCLFAQNFSQKEQKEITTFNNIITNSSSHDTVLLKAYDGIFNMYYAFNLDSVFLINQKLIDIANKGLKGDKYNNKESFSVQKSLALGYNNKGIYWHTKGELDSALFYYEKSLAIYEDFNIVKEKGELLSNMGVVYQYKGDVPKMIDFHSRSFLIREEFKDSLGMVSSLQSLGIIYFYQNDTASSMINYKKALEIAIKIGDERGEASCLYNIATCTLNKENAEEVIKQLNRVLVIRKKVNHIRGVAYTYSAIGGAYKMINELDSAMFYYQKALPIFEENELKTGATLLQFKLGMLAAESNNYELANTLAAKSYKSAYELKIPGTIANAHRLYYEIYKGTNQWKLALEHYENYRINNDSVLNDNNQKAAIRQQEKFEFEKKKALDDKENEKKVGIEKEKQKRQYAILIAVIIASSLIFILLIIIYRRLRITRKQKVIIEETNEELNQTNEEIAAQRDEIEQQKNKVEEAHLEIRSSINYAKRIQEAILPSIDSIHKNLTNAFVLYKPKDVVAGDFYWMEKIQNKIYIAAADCTGHGVPGAMVSVVCSNALSKSLLEEGKTNVGELLDRTRELVIDRLAKSGDIKDGMDISLACFDIQNMKLEWAGANNPLFFIRNNEIKITKGDREPIGYTENPTSFIKHAIPLLQGDTIYLFTDGYPDQFGGPNGKKLGYKKFREKLVGISSEEMDSQKDQLELFFKQWKDEEEQVDDVCIIGVRV